MANELTARDTNNTGGNEHTLSYTAAGQLADDDQHYEYIYDAWGRLVEIENQSSVTVASFEYNGLGHRIGHQWDKDADTDLDWQWLGIRVWRAGQNKAPQKAKRETLATRKGRESPAEAEREGFEPPDE